MIRHETRRSQAGVAAVAGGLSWVAAAAAQAASLTYSGTTTGASTFNRPLSNGTAAPTALASNAPAAHYVATTYTATATGVYDLTSIATSAGTFTALWDNYLFVYNGTFTAGTPLTNVVVGNDDDNGTIGRAATLGVSLTAGQSYTFVTTGAANGDVGTFANSLYQQSVLQSGTTVGGSTWDPFGASQAIPYKTVAFTVGTTGTYNLLSTAGYDNFVALYQNAFNAGSPDTNLVASNDDNQGSATRAGLAGQTLTTGVTYYLVTTGSGVVSGTFTNTISGPGAVTAVGTSPAALYFTGNQTATLAGTSGTLTNFSTDAAGTLISALLPGSGTDVFFAASGNTTAANFATTLGSALSVNSLTFGTGANGTTGVTVGGSGTITIAAGNVAYASGVGIVVNGGAAANTIAANVALGASQSWTNNSSNALTVSGGVSLGTNALTLAGTGSTAISGVISGSGGVTATGSGAITLTGANTYTGTTTVNSTSTTLTVGPSASTVLLAGSGTTGGTNIANGAVAFTYSGTSPAGTIRPLLAAGYAVNFASGTLRSSTAVSGTRGLGYSDTGTSVIVKAALYGDLNLDGSVLIGDFNTFAINFGTATGEVWTDGDFTYDGAVNISDFNLLAVNFGQSLPSAADWAPLIAFAAAHDDLTTFAALTGVPEPASVTLLAATAAVGLRRRRAGR